MKRLGAAAAIIGLIASGIVAASPASAMGSGNPYEDMQVGVTYTVYQPSNVAGLKNTGVGNTLCTDGAEQNTIVLYGKASKAQLSVTEGNPICSDPDGTGKVVGRPKVLGAKAIVTAFCDPAVQSEWKNCSTADVARYGGALQVKLPGVGSLRATNVILVTSGKKPISYDALVKVARSMKPVTQTLVGGMVKCTQAEFAQTIKGGLPAGQSLFSVDGFGCKDGWAYAFATVGADDESAVTVTYVFEAEGQFWIPKDRADVCGTVNVSSPSTRPADAQVPASIWQNACATN